SVLPAARLAAVVGRAVTQRDEHRHGNADLRAIDLDAIPTDVARLFEALHALHDCGPRETDLIGDRLVAGTAVLGEDAEDAAVGSVELCLGGQLGCSGVCS